MPFGFAGGLEVRAALMWAVKKKNETNGKRWEFGASFEFGPRGQLISCVCWPSPNETASCLNKQEDSQ